MSSSVEKSYNQWAPTYDSVENKTRDLDAQAIQSILSDVSFRQVLELGCGTGKNTEWLAAKSKHVTAVDFSDGMIQKAKQKITAQNVTFLQADITHPWIWADEKYDLICCNLILEHIRDLHPIFSEAARVLNANGKFFISELHPMKQYLGSKARYEKEGETIVLDCYIHHVSDYFNCAVNNGFRCLLLDEWFDEGSELEVPRLITFLFQRTNS